MSEFEYKEVIEKFLSGTIGADEFVRSYMDVWRKCRDSGIAESHSEKFQRLTSRIFTSCDVYDPNPEKEWEFNEKQLKEEVDLLAYIWWG